MIHNNNTLVDVNTIAGLNNIPNPSLPLEKPKPVDIGDFNQALSRESQCSNKSCSDAPVSAQDAGKSGDNSPEAMMKELLTLLLELLSVLQDSKKGSGGEKKPNDCDTSSGTEVPNNKAAKIKNNNVVPENNSVSGQIPKPIEHMQSADLGGKQVIIGGDGTASASEVAQTKNELVKLYENSPSFKNMIDQSPNQSFEMSVGKRSDNMSWGNADGRVFMNINNILPDSSDNFQALTAHEFAHAGVGMDHGNTMQNFEKRVYQEA